MSSAENRHFKFKYIMKAMWQNNKKKIVKILCFLCIISAAYHTTRCETWQVILFSLGTLLCMKLRRLFERNIFSDGATFHKSTIVNTSIARLLGWEAVTNSSEERTASMFTATQPRWPELASSHPSEPKISGIIFEFEVMFHHKTNIPKLKV